ncbi:MAG: PEP-CTERM system TPR-repeat protein PrsT [Colwellia sp.]|nr:PEP-CTERM system TPR-repeat protein PrsT [Colwellia sp.]
MNKLVTITTALALTILITACSENKTVKQYLQSATEFSAKSDYGSAVVELKNAVRLNPKNADVRLLLGRVYLEQGSYINAEKELKRAERLGIEGIDVLADLAFIKYKLNKPEEVYSLIENANDLDDKEYVKILTFAGITALNNKSNDRAEDYFSQAQAVDSSSLYGLLSSAYLNFANKNYLLGLEIVEEIIDSNNDFSEAVLLKAHLLLSLDKYSEAYEFYKQYRQRHVLANYIRYFEVNSLLLSGDYQKADIEVSKLLEIFEQAPLAHQYKAQVEFQKQNYTEARVYANKVAQLGNEFIVAKIIAGLSSYQLGDKEQAYGYLNPLNKYLPNSHPIKRVIAVLNVELGYAADAVQTFSDFDGYLPSDVDLMQASSFELMKSGDILEAEQLITLAQELAPENALVAAQQGLLLLSKSDMSGIKSLERALELDPKLYKIELALAMQYLATGEDKKAEQIANKLLQSEGSEVSGYLLQGIIETKQQLPSKAIESFNKVLAKDETNIAAMYNLAVLLESEDKLAKSISLYQNILNILPDHRGAIQRLSLLQKKNNNTAENIIFLKGLELNKVKDFNLIIGLAQNYKLNNDLIMAISTLEQISSSKNLPQRYWLVLGDSYLQNNQFELAITTFSKASVKYPQYYTLRLRYIGMLEIEKKYNEALIEAHAAYQMFPNNIRLASLVAYYELLNNNIENSRLHINKLLDKNIKTTFLDNLSGQLALADKNYPLAIEYFSAIYEKQQTAQYALSLARALAFNKQKAEAEKVLEEHLVLRPDISTRVLLASLYKKEDFQKKNVQYQLILEEAPNNISVLNNIAWGEYRLNNVDKAIEYIEKAYALNANYLPVIETYGVILIANKNTKKAMEILKQAESKGSTDTNVLLALAELHLNNNNYKESTILLNKIQIDNVGVKERINKIRNQLESMND